MELVNLQRLVGDRKDGSGPGSDFYVFYIGASRVLTLAINCNSRGRRNGPTMCTSPSALEYLHRPAQVAKDRVQLQLVEAEVRIGGPVLRRCTSPSIFRSAFSNWDCPVILRFAPCDTALMVKSPAHSLVERKIVEMDGVQPGETAECRTWP